MSTASFYKSRFKYGGMDASMISQMKALEDENRRLHMGIGGITPAQTLKMAA
jgi:hypothetical protein